MKIIGVGILLFSAVLLGVGIHHLVATGTCSSTGYSANYGPVPKCPSGTGWWFAFVFGGVIGSLIGAGMATSLGLVFGGIFGGIGFGALSIVLDSHVHHGNKIFGGIFGGCFALVGSAAWIAVGTSALGSLRKARGAGGTPSATTTIPGFSPPQTSSAFGTPSKDADPILSAYNASRTASPITASAAPAAAARPSTPSRSPLNLIPGLMAAQQAASGDAVDELAKLAELHKSGALTDEEFARAKAKLLGQM